MPDFHNTVHLVHSCNRTWCHALADSKARIVQSQMVPLSNATDSFWEVVQSDLDFRERSQWVGEHDLLFFAEVNNLVHSVVWYASADSKQKGLAAKQQLFSAGTNTDA